MTLIPEEFRLRMKAEMGETQALRLMEELEKTPSVSIRVNAAKCRPDTRAEIEKGADGRVEWCADGLRYNVRPEFITDPLLHAGVYYVQEAGSMFYQTLLERLIPEFSDTERLRVVDLCAAPGGKTTAMLNALYKSGKAYELIANEYDRKRVAILEENIKKWGDRNVIVTNSEASKLGNLQNTFDIVAVDAPCSGEGMMRREPVARSQWSERLVEDCARLQREIVADILPALRPGGILIYSTCTFNRAEDEENVKYFVEELGLEIVEAPRRFMPHECECEGLFVATLRKTSAEEGVINGPVRREIIPLLQKNKVHIISVGNKEEAHLYIDLTREEALQYLRGMALTLPDGSPLGIVTVGYDGYPLGQVKNIGLRANNLYPKEWRVRK